MIEPLNEFASPHDRKTVYHHVLVGGEGNKIYSVTMNTSDLLNEDVMSRSFEELAKVLIESFSKNGWPLYYGYFSGNTRMMEFRVFNPFCEKFWCGGSFSFDPENNKRCLKALFQQFSNKVLKNYKKLIK